jgi:hypothetical protein
VLKASGIRKGRVAWAFGREAWLQHYGVVACRVPTGLVYCAMGRIQLPSNWLTAGMGEAQEQALAPLATQNL